MHTFTQYGNKCIHSRWIISAEPLNVNSYNNFKGRILTLYHALVVAYLLLQASLHTFSKSIVQS